MSKPKAILVTGCAGFIGSNFVKTFSNDFEDTEVVGIDDFSTGSRTSLAKNITFYEGSLLEELLVEKVFERHKPEYIFHFAALPRVSYSLEHPRKSTEVNIVGTVALLEAAKKFGAKRFIYSSSSSVYGGAKKLPTKESENPPNPKSPYAMQKYAGEPFCKIFSELFDVDTVCLRYFNAFGPGQYGNSAYASVIPAWLESIYFPSANKPFLEGDGTQSRDFCFIDNIVSANILAMKAKDSFKGEVFNVAHGEQTTLNETISLIEKLTGKKLKLEKRQPRLGDVQHSCADITKAGEMLGYKPGVSFEEGLQKTIHWFESRKR